MKKKKESLFDEYGVRHLKCPSCGELDCMAERQVLYGLTPIVGVNRAGELEYVDETEIDWDSQQATEEALRFECTNCGEAFSSKELGITNVRDV